MEAADYAFALSIAQAVEADAALIATLLQEDEQARRDRDFAQQLEQDSEEEPASPTHETDAQNGQLDDERFDTLRLFNIPPPETNNVSPVADDTTTTSDDVDVDMDDDSDVNDEQTPQDFGPGQDDNTYEMIDEGPGEEQEPEQVEGSPESQSLFATPSSPPTCTLETAECISCSDGLPVCETFEAPCSHTLCRTCLANWIQTSIQDESSFPLKCCGQIIPVALDNPLISDEQFGEYEAKKVELETPDRTYCSDATCAAFIPLPSIEVTLRAVFAVGRRHVPNAS